MQQPENDDESAKSGDPPLINALLQRINELEERVEKISSKASSHSTQSSKSGSKTSSNKSKQVKKKQNKENTFANISVLQAPLKWRATAQPAEELATALRDRYVEQTEPNSYYRQIAVAVQKACTTWYRNPYDHQIAQLLLDEAENILFQISTGATKQQMDTFRRKVTGTQMDTRYAQAWKKTPATAGVKQQPWKKGATKSVPNHSPRNGMLPPELWSKLSKETKEAIAKARTRVIHSHLYVSKRNDKHMDKAKQSVGFRHEPALGGTANVGEIVQQALTARTSVVTINGHSFFQESKTMGDNPTQAVILQLERHRKEANCKWTTVARLLGSAWGAMKKSGSRAFMGAERLQAHSG